ncbi:MAG: hypothetical protein HYS46_05305 [Betaproteobacteria bacterium]|nr:hypothetical protein [Betaproteobacteria bacterium]
MGKPYATPLRIALIACLLLAACVAEVRRVPSADPVFSGNPRFIRIARDLSVELHTGYHRTLKQDSSWTYIGSIAQGEVFRSSGDALTVEGAHVHEAYLVVSGGRLVGFYLPVEKAFAPLATQPVLPTK